MMLRDQEVQALFAGYEFNDSKAERKKSLRSTNGTDTEYLSLRGSWKWSDRFNNFICIFYNSFITNMVLYSP